LEAYDPAKAVSLAEQAALSFAILKLREKLFNRRSLDESLERELPSAIRKNRSLGIIMLDVDRFKKQRHVRGFPRTPFGGPASSQRTASNATRKSLQIINST